MRGCCGALLIGALGLLSGSPAGALDLVTGSYEGKLSCRGIAAGQPVKSKQAVTVLVGENMTGDVLLEIFSSEDGPIATAVSGFLAEDAGQPRRAQLFGVECGLSWLTHDGAALHADVTIRPGSEQGKLKGTLVRMDPGGSSGSICKLSAKRVSTESPALMPCM